MKLKQYLLLSVGLHVFLLASLVIVSKINLFEDKPKMISINAKVVFKDAKKADEHHLPRKNIAPPKAKQVANPNLANTKPKNNHNFLQELDHLSKEYEQEIVEHKGKKALQEEALYNDGDYLDSVHATIKQNFILPSHLNDPNKKSISATVKVFIDSLGKLSSARLEKSSGDKDFDEAILFATKKVTNFGNPPVLMQKSLQQNGILIQFCPFECREGG